MNWSLQLYTQLKRITVILLNETNMKNLVLEKNSSITEAE